MSDEARCGQCGEAFPIGNAGAQLAGLCPRCLAAGLLLETSTGSGVRVDDSPLKPGAVFRGLEILELLGRGGMGCVYKARQQSLDRLIALKVLAPGLTLSEEFVRRFEREAKALAAFNHPNVVRVYDFGREGDMLFLAMEYVDGRTLDAMFEQEKPADLVELLTILQGVAKGLDHIHRAELVHRDIKPTNILIARDGTPKIADFGIAVEAENGKKLTETGTFVGTPYYVSPEHVLGKRVDGRSDLYSLGVMLYEGIAGKTPFEGKSSTAVLMKHLKEAPPPLHIAAPGTPAALQELARRLLAKNPASRPDSAAAVAHEFQRLLEALGAPKSSPREPRNERRSRPPSKRPVPPAILAGAAAVLISGALFAIFARTFEPPSAAVPVVRGAAAPPPPQESDPAEPAPGPPAAPKRTEPSSVPPAGPSPMPDPSPKNALDAVLAAGDKLLEDARTEYTQAKARESADGFMRAGFLAEDARLKFQAAQELAEGDRLAHAISQLSALQQLVKLINDGKKSAGGPAPAPPLPVVALPVPAPPALPASPRRSPAPDATRLAQAEKEIRTVLKDDYTRKSAAEKKDFAGRLLQMGSDPNEDPANRWVLLRDSAELAIQSGDMATLVGATEKTLQWFEADEFAVRLAAFGKAAAAAKGADNCRILADALIKLAREATRAGAFDGAVSALQKAEIVAKNIPDAARATSVQELRKEATLLKDEYQKVKPALENREAGDPEDVGKYLCFVKGDWEQGLPLLKTAAGSPLKLLAEKDLARSGETAKRVEVGDGWWTLAEKATLPLKRERIRDRARYWYEMALPGTTGLLRSLIEKRLGELAPRSDRPKAIDLLSLIDIGKDCPGVKWEREGNALSSPANVLHPRLQIPYEAPEEYDLQLVVERKEGMSSIDVGLATPSRWFVAVIDGWEKGDVSVLLPLDGRTGPENETTVRGKFLSAGRPATLLYSVRRESVTVSVDGRIILSWKGNLNRLGSDYDLGLASRKVFFLQTANSRYAVTSIELVPLLGEGRRLRPEKPK